ncbi:succinate dehydrogenase assembly factor 2 [Hyphomicrobium sp. DY-1]|uniref:FAD assembly factor SdhE n=1 Tax=Hyphomicrobium sp. DY-1 TaxID=3075650 RepID=UPI0039C1053A
MTAGRHSVKLPAALYTIAMQPELQMTDELETRRRRASYRAHHRGTKEMDVLVGRYADDRLPGYSGEEIARFERFLTIPDPALQQWIFSGEGFAGIEFEDLVNDIRAFHGLSATAS